MTDLTVKINDITVKDGEKIPLNQTQTKPIISFNKESNKLYTIIMADPDAPFPSNPKYKYWLHMLTINNNMEFAPFNPPSPPAGSDYHRYFIFVYEQDHKINMNEMEPIKERNNFKLADFVHKHSLKEISSVYFMTKRE
jgi:phosphatidylethanolamine-binding protein